MSNIREILQMNLIKYLKLRKITQKQLSEYLEVSQPAVTNWVKGNNSPDIELIAKMCDIFNVSIIDLMTEEKQEHLSKTALSFDEQQLLSNYKKLNADGKEKLLGYSDDLLSSGKYAEDEYIEKHA